MKNRRKRTRRALFILLAIATGLLIGRAAAFHLTLRQAALQPVAGGEAAIELAETRRDFGPVPAGDPLTATFHVRNAGTRRLVLNEEICGSCEEDPAEQTILIPPGASQELTVTLETAGLAGRILQDRRFTTNDPHTPQFTLSLLAEIIPPSSDAD